MPTINAEQLSTDWSISMASKQWIKTLGALLLIAAAAFLFYEKIFVPKHSYKTLRPVRGDMNLTVFGIATVEARTLYPVGSNYGGKLLEILKDQGESVQKGDLIARIDPVDLPDQIAQAQARLRNVEFSIQAAKKELQSLEAQRRLAQINFKRYDKLSLQGYAAKAEYDKALADLESIEAQIAAQKAQIEAQMALKTETERSIAALKAKASRLEIHAPVSGLIVRRDADPSQTVAPQQAIVTIVRPRDVWVSATIDEALSKDLHAGERATIRLRSRPHETLAGHVARIEPESDPVTEERIVEVAFEKLPYPFYLKEQAEVTIDAGLIRHAFIVPVSALQHGGVWVDRGGEAHFKKIKVLAEQGGKAAVAGLKGDEIILLPDPHKKPLSEGTRVYR
jgi:RND family efflux transporter MFP subunit